MAALMQALLRRDSLLGRGALYDNIFRRQFSAHPLLTGYTIGLEEQRVNGYFAVSKGGTAPGFLTNMLLFPEQNLGLFITINTQTDNALDSLFAAFKAVFPGREAISRPTFTGTVNTGAFAGVYRNNRCSHSTIEEMFQLFQGPVTIRDGGGGAVEMILNGELYRYLPVNDSVFQRDDGLGPVIVFSNFREGRPYSLYTTVEINGLQLPASFGRLRWYERPRFVNDEFPAVFLVIGFYLLLPLYWLVRRIVRRRKPDWLNFRHLGKTAHLPALAFVAATAAHLLGFLLPLAKRREELLFGLPASLTAIKYLTWLMAVLAGVLIVQTVRIWRLKEGWAGIRLYYTLFALAAVAYVLFLWRWHFMSMAA
jgi:hypothetical protein